MIHCLSFFTLDRVMFGFYTASWYLRKVFGSAQKEKYVPKDYSSVLNRTSGQNSTKAHKKAHKKALMAWVCDFIMIQIVLIAH